MADNQVVIVDSGNKLGVDNQILIWGWFKNSIIFKKLFREAVSINNY